MRTYSTPITFPPLEEVVAQIEALPYKPENVREPTGSLRELLASDPEDAEIDLEAWTQEWAMAEEMKAIRPLTCCPPL